MIYILEKNARGKWKIMPDDFTRSIVRHATWQIRTVIALANNDGTDWLNTVTNLEVSNSVRISIAVCYAVAKSVESKILTN